MYLVTMYSSTHAGKPVAVFSTEKAAKTFILRTLERAKAAGEFKNEFGWYDVEPIDFFPEQTPKAL